MDKLDGLSLLSKGDSDEEENLSRKDNIKFVSNIPLGMVNVSLGRRFQ